MAAGAVEVNITTPSARAGVMFDGVANKIELTEATYDLDSASFCFWAKKNSPTADCNIMGRGAIGTYSFIRLYTDGRVILETNTNGDDFQHDVGNFDTAWHHYAFSCDTKNITLYVDGVFAKTDSVSDNDLTLYHFGYLAAVFMAGAMADMRIFNRPITQTEVTAVYRGQSVTEGLVSRWELTSDYVDSVGANDGTNTGTYFGIFDDTVSTAIKADRTTANDKYLMTAVAGQIVSSVIEEAA